jgi:dienelactone hydrolase
MKAVGVTNTATNQLLVLAIFILLVNLITASDAAARDQFDGKQSKYFSFSTHKAKSPSPTVIVAHGCDGLGEWTEDWRKRILDWGYNVVVVEQFRKRGFPTGVCNRGSIVPPDERNEDIGELVDWIKTRDWHLGGVGLIGMSHGGAVAIDAAINTNTHERLKATIALYPSCINIRYNYENPKIPVQVHLGKQDNWTPCLSSNWSNYESYVYENAGHSFDIDRPKRRYDGYTLWYDREATTLSQDRIKNFLAKHLR